MRTQVKTQSKLGNKSMKLNSMQKVRQQRIHESRYKYNKCIQIQNKCDEMHHPADASNIYKKLYKI